MNARRQATATGVHNPDWQAVYHFFTLSSACGWLHNGLLPEQRLEEENEVRALLSNVT